MSVEPFEPFATIEQYDKKFDDRDCDADVLWECLMEASAKIQAALDEAGIEVDGSDARQLWNLMDVCRIVTHRAFESLDDTIPYGATQVNMTAGPYTRGYSLGNPYGDIRLLPSDLKQLGIGAPRASVMSPYGGA